MTGFEIVTLPLSHCSKDKKCTKSFVDLLNRGCPINCPRILGLIRVVYLEGVMWSDQ